MECFELVVPSKLHDSCSRKKREKGFEVCRRLLLLRDRRGICLLKADKCPDAESARISCQITCKIWMSRIYFLSGFDVGVSCILQTYQFHHTRRNNVAGVKHVFLLQLLGAQGIGAEFE